MYLEVSELLRTLRTHFAYTCTLSGSIVFTSATRADVRIRSTVPHNVYFYTFSGLVLYSTKSTVDRFLFLARGP